MGLALLESTAMQKTLATHPTPGSPFFDLLADAEEIKIREVPPESEPTDISTRTFLVRIKNKPEILPVKTETVPTTPENRTYLLKSAELLLVDHDFLLARNIYSYLLKVNIRDEQALKGLGQCFLDLGDTTSAKKCFKALVEISGAPEANLWVGRCLILEGKDNEALGEMRKITDPSCLPLTSQAELFREMGNCETRAQHYDAAWSLYHQALKIEPSSDTIHVNLGTLELQRQHPDIALAYFTMALKLNSQSARGHCGLGLVAIAKHDLTTARNEFEITLDLDSQNIVALFQLIRLYADEDDITSVKDRIRRFLQKEPRQVEVRYALAVLLFRESDWLGCEREITALLIHDPKHARAKGLRDQINHNRHLPA